jgi:riboflavin kinase/FMN adenylyltransferase
MKTFNTLDNLPKDAKGHIIAIGNFDGVHRGHQALIEKAKHIAQKENLSVGVLTFEPHPRELFQPDQPPARLTPAPLKAQQMQEQGIDFLFSLPFDWSFASQSAEEFVQNILIDGLKTNHVVIGYDFRFGQLRKGSAETIKEAGLYVDTIDPVSDDKGETISSSRIRQLLRAGDIAMANALLGWEWEIQGAIFRGDRRGHELGYPTANVLLKDTLHPAYGVYASKVKIEGEEEWLNAATNIGIRPMFELSEGQAEAHILDFPDRDIYDKILSIKPIQRLRGEAKFNSVEDLIAQMEKDCEQARAILF